jgi:tetratricopeptide (TPR) repeat protein
LGEIQPEFWKGELRLEGYIPVPLSLSITASETNSFRTNLVNWHYTQAMESARSYLATDDSERALEALSAALKANPNDPDALAMQEKSTALRRETTVTGHLRQAEEMLGAKNYVGVRSEANAVLKIVPDHERAMVLLNELAIREKEDLKRAQEKAEAQLQERLALPKKTFDSALQLHSEASLFEEHELHAALPVDQVETAIRLRLAEAPAFKVMKIRVSAPEAFAMSAWQEVPGGSRRCMIAGAQIGDKDIHVFFKVMEYKSKSSVSFQGQLTISKSFVPLDPSRLDELTERQKTQLKEGAVIVEERIRRAVGWKSL